MQDIRKPQFCAEMKPLPKEEGPKSKCKQHPEFDLDTICFHPDCRRTRNQITCYCCATEHDPHRAHTDHLFPIYWNSPAFRQVNFSNENILLAWMESEQQEIKECLGKLHEVLDYFKECVVKQALQRIDCAADFLQKNGVYKVCSRIRHYGDAHSDCCLSLLNKLKALEERGTVTQQQAEITVRKQLVRQSQQLKGQISFISQEFQAIIEKSMETHYHGNQEQPQQRILTSEVISFQERFPHIPQPSEANQLNQKLNESLSEGSAIDLENDHVKISESAMKKIHQQTKHRKIIRKYKKKGQVKERKIIKIFNQQNKTSPIDLDVEAEQEKVQKQSPQLPEKEDSLIDQLVNSQTSAIITASQANPQKRSHRSSKEAIALIDRQKWPIGVDAEDNDTLVIWNADKLDEIIQFLSETQSVTHLIILDTKASTEDHLLKIVCSMPWLKGLHLQCESHITKTFLSGLEIPYFSCFPNFRFIKTVDKVKYFPKLRPSMLQNHSHSLAASMTGKFYNVFVQSPSNTAIRANTEEATFMQDNSDLLWVFGPGIQQNLLKVDKLLVLAFSSILIRKSVNLKPVYERQRNLHTLVFDNVQCQHNDIVGQLRFLLANQLSHFQLSGDNLERKILLGQEEAEEIFRLTTLETLILTNVEFRLPNKKIEKNSSRILRKIQNLDKLSYLNVYNTEPIYSDFISYLNRACIKTLKVLNLGCSEINSEAAAFLEKFNRLEALAIDYTEIGEGDLLKITSKMPSLEQLSVENLSGGKITYEEENLNNSKKKYGALTPSFFDRLKYKTLRYANIFNCQLLADYDWSGFAHLECLRMNTGLLKEAVVEKLSKRGIKIYVDGVDDENNLLFRQRKPSESNSSAENEGKKKKEPKNKTSATDQKTPAKGRTEEKAANIKVEVRRNATNKGAAARSELLIQRKDSQSPCSPAIKPSH